MMNGDRPIFTPDWPYYAIAAHVLFWAASTLLLAAIAGAIFGLWRAQFPLSLFAIWLFAAGLLGAAAIFSGKLYAGNQVFARTPMTGTSARVSGVFVLGGVLFLFFIGFGLSQMRGI